MGCIIKELKEAIKRNKRIERALQGFLSDLDAIEKEASKDVYMISGTDILNPGKPLQDIEFEYRGQKYKSLKAAIDKAVPKKASIEQQEKVVKKVVLEFYSKVPAMRVAIEGEAGNKFMVLEDDKWTYTNLYGSALNALAEYVESKEDTKKEDDTISTIDMNKKAEENAKKLKKQCSNKGGK